MPRVLHLLTALAVLIPVAGAAYVLRAQITPHIISPSAEKPAQGATISAKPVPQDVRKEMVNAVNQERTKRGIPALRRNVFLDRAAQAHAQDMLTNNYFSHTSRDGRSPSARMIAAGYKPPVCNCIIKTSYGENIIRDRKTAQDAVNAWMQSTVHRGNILSTGFQDIGIGSVGGMWVQTFGKISVQQR